MKKRTFSYVTLFGLFVEWGCGEPRCPNGVIEEDEACDDKNNTQGDGCDSNCTLSACGNGIQDFTEECDDGNVTPGDGCNSQCEAEVCSNDILDAGEECDDGNRVNTDSCTAKCLFAACGDGFTQPVNNEVCDDGNTEDGDGCKGDCSAIESCGDSVVQEPLGEQCDDGNHISGDGCRGDCAKTEVCGDGTLDLGEQCDDGNAAAEDGCNGVCEIEFCGDGFLQAALGEECDDNNSVNNDGCGSQCSIVDGSCTAPFTGFFGTNFGNTAGRPNLADGSCVGGGDVVYVLTSAFDTTLNFTLRSVSPDPLNSLFEDLGIFLMSSCGSGELACANSFVDDGLNIETETLSFEIAANQTIFIFVTESISGGPFLLELQ